MQSQSTKLIIFDLDDTLVHESPEDPALRKACAETVSVLQYLKDRGHVLAIASHNLRAKEIAVKEGIDHYFQCGTNDLILAECPPCFTKMSLVRQILKATKINAKDAVFFDDLIEMISDVRRNIPDIQVKLVDYRTGIRMQDLVEMQL